MALSLSTESRVQRDLKRWMKVRHLTQKRLGRSLGLCRKTVGHILAKRGRLLQRHVDVALRELGLDPLEFYTAALSSGPDSASGSKGRTAGPGNGSGFTVGIHGSRP